MGVSTQQRILFGLKVKQYRQARGLSFSDLAGLTGMSVSYLNEIEKGKKYPKENKIHLLSAALQVTDTELCSLEVGEGLAPVAELLRSNFLNELPLDLFGIEMNKVVEMIAGAPARVGAFISTMLELARDYAVKEDNFYFGALRSYLELHNNFFEDLELEVERFSAQYAIPEARPFPVDYLRTLLETHFGYRVSDSGLDAYPELIYLRSVFLPKHRELLLNSALNPIQRSFQFGKEIAFEHMGLKERAFTSSLLRGRAFEEVLNHSKAIYFSVALHIPQQQLVDSLADFFQKECWDGNAFLDIMHRFDATPEMLFHRMTNLLPRFFGMRKLFFLRFIHDPAQQVFRVDKELYLNLKHYPNGNRLHEHYCRRWLSIASLQELNTLQRAGDFPSHLAGVQVSHYLNTEDAYLCLTIVRPDYPVSGRNVSVTIGIQISPEIRARVRFLQDETIPHRQVHTTCERCPLLDCTERDAEPVLAEKRQRLYRVEERLRELYE